MKGWTADEIIGEHFRIFYPPERRDERHPEHELALAIRDGRYEEEGWRVRKDGDRFWANVVITALFDHEGHHVGYAKVTRDMTERRSAETARELAAADLAVSNGALVTAALKTEEFLAITAHELQSPVAAINGAADILLDYWDRLEPVERRETLQRITQGGTRIRRLLDDLLTASRLDAGTFGVTPERVSVGDAVERAVNEVGPAVGSVILRDIDGAAVTADNLRLVQILTNLLTNAAKYGKAPYVVEARRSGSVIEIVVRDAGTGVPDHLVPRLFEKFATDQRSTMGTTGLGLYIVRELARLQGGDAWYEPDGAFVVSLPAAE
jgi:PAS domain S-box-containing protein